MMANISLKKTQKNPKHKQTTTAQQNPQQKPKQVQLFLFLNKLQTWIKQLMYTWMLEACTGPTWHPIVPYSASLTLLLLLS